MLEKMKELIADQLSVEAENITEASSFKEDLGADSLDLFELVMALEDEYNVEIPAEDLEKLSTVGDVIAYLKDKGIPTMIYYSKPMSCQTAFKDYDCRKVDLSVTEQICQRILALPLHPYMMMEEQEKVMGCIKEFLNAV